MHAMAGRYCARRAAASITAVLTPQSDLDDACGPVVRNKGREHMGLDDPVAAVDAIGCDRFRVEVVSVRADRGEDFAQRRDLPVC